MNTGINKLPTSKSMKEWVFGEVRGYLIGAGEDWVSLLVREEDGSGDKEGLDGFAQPPHQFRLGRQPVPQFHAKVDLGQGVGQQPESENEGWCKNRASKGLEIFQAEDNWNVAKTISLCKISPQEGGAKTNTVNCVKH
jgi:hypothetical protein